jgi:hypothetical protein
MKPRIQNYKAKTDSSKSSMERVDSIIDKIILESESVKWYNMHKASNGYLIDKNGRRVSSTSSNLADKTGNNRIQRIIEELNIHLKKKNELNNLRSG